MNYRILLFACCFLISNIHAFAQHSVTPEENKKYTTHIVKVTGDVEHPLTFTVDTLLNWGTKHAEKTTTENGTATTSNYDYYPLKDLLDKAVVKRESKKDRAFYIVARGSDGYKVVFSWAEIFDGDSFVYVVVKENGQLIKEKGDMKVTNANRQSGAQHAYFLSSIEVHHVD